MSTRIIFNGQEYSSTEAMPDDVRTMYQQTLSQLADADHNGIPDALERQGAGAGNVIGIQNSSITVNGKTYGSVEEMPGWVRFIFEQAMAQLTPTRPVGLDPIRDSAADAPGGLLRQRTSEAGHVPDESLMQLLDQSENVLSTVLVVVLAAAAGAVIVLGSWMITHMDESSRSQGGVLYVGFAMVVVLGAIAGQFINLWWRKQK
jgi:hypothetical protein